VHGLYDRWPSFSGVVYKEKEVCLVVTKLKGDTATFMMLARKDIGESKIYRRKRLNSLGIT